MDTLDAMTSAPGSAALAACTIIALAAAPCLAQERGGFGESVDVELVSLDVLVTDRDGRPVTDLSREDFRLFDEGRPVEIGHFSPPSGTVDPAGAPATAEEGAPAPPRPETGPAPDLLVIFLDQLHLIPTSRDRALRQLATVLDERLDRRTEVLLASFDGAVDVPLAPTRDRKKLWVALAEELVYGAQALQLHREDSQILNNVRETLEIHIEDLLRSFIPPDQIMDLACSSTSLFARTHADRERARIEATASALREFLASFAAYPGRKTLLHVSDGISMVAGLKPMEYLISLCNGTAQFQGLEADTVLSCCPPARFFASAAQLEIHDYLTADAWGEVVAEANVQRVTLYTLQALGLTAPDASGVDSVRATSAPDFVGRMNRQDPLVLMAEETGGRSMLNTNDFRGDLARMLDDRTLRYELGFYPQGPVDRKVHTLRLEVDRPGARLRYRQSYARRTARERVTAGVLGALYHGRQENRHRLRLTTELRGEPDKRTVEVDVELRIPLAGLVLLPDGEGSKGLVTVFASARDRRGATLPVGEKRIPLAIGPGDDAEEYRYVVRMPLPRDRDWQVAVALHDELGDETSYVTTLVRLEE